MSFDSEGAASSVMGMMLAAALFVAIVGVVLYVGNDTGGNQQHRLDSQFYQHRAQALSATLLDSPGFSTTGNDWSASDADAEALARLGLRHEDAEYLNFTKFENLRLAELAANATDGHVNYPEAIGSLGLDDAEMDFHVRAYPSLRSVREILEDGHRDPHLKVAYIGDIGPSNGNAPIEDEEPDPPAGLAIGTVTCSQSPLDSKVVRLEVQVTNGGTTDTVFHVVFDVDYATGADVRREDISSVVLAGSPTTVAVDFSTTSAHECSDIDEVDVEVSDTSTNLLFEWEDQAVTLLSPDASGTLNQQLWMRGDGTTLYVVVGAAANLAYDGPGNNDYLDFYVKDSAGTVVHTQSDVKSKDLDNELQVPASALTAAGTYTAYLHHDATDVLVTHKVVVVASAPSVYTPPVGGGTGETTGELDQWSDAALVETRILEDLVWNFCPYYYNDNGTTPVADITHEDRCPFRPTSRLTDQYGDVFPHTASKLVDAMRPRLVFPDGHAQEGEADVNTTQLLVIGSNVNHQGLVHIKDDVRTWVAGGGTLLVFGSDDTNTQWLRSLYSIGIDASNNGIAAVNDASHPVLHKPDELDYGRYRNTVDDETVEWGFNSEAEYNKFANVIGDEEEMTSVLGVSDAGSFGKGNILLTSFFPYDVFRTGMGEDTSFEATKFVNNLLMLGYRTLYLDYGPEIPDGVKVIPATSTAEIMHPQLGLVTLSIVVYVFPG